MKETDLHRMLSSIGVRPNRANRKGWMEFPCPLSPWTHERGRDGRPSAAARVDDTGTSFFVCKACHHKGSMSKLMRLMADFSGDDRYRPLIREAERAENETRLQTNFAPFDAPPEEPPPEPLVEAAYRGIYPAATQVPVAMEYLSSRGISARTAGKLDLQYDDRQHRVLFPVRSTQGLWGFTGRAIAPGVNPKVRDYVGLPKEFVILGEERWREGFPKIIVEGLFAYAHLHEIEVDERADIGAILGSAMTPHKAARIINADSPTYLLFDNDQGGDIGIYGTLTPTGAREENGAVHYLAEHVPLFVPVWPEGKDDPDQLTRQEVDAMLDETASYAADGVLARRWQPWV